jgi:hypothetical protein
MILITILFQWNYKKMHCCQRASSLNAAEVFVGLGVKKTSNYVIILIM